MSLASERFYTAANPDLLSEMPVQATTVLDVGCGTGGNAQLLATQGKFVDGITLSHREAQAATPHCRRVEVYDLEQGLPQSMCGPYDVCLASHLLEHLRNPSPLLEAVHVALRPGGTLLVALPNLLFWRNRLRILAGKFEYESQGIMDSDHVKFYTVSSSRRLLESHGFLVERVWAQGWLPMAALRRVFGNSISGKLDLWAANTFPDVFGWQFFLKCVNHV